MRAQRCETCKWWEMLSFHKTWSEEERAVREYGQCRRHPPTAMSGYMEIEGKGCWPETRKHEWCGEWEEHQTGSTNLKGE